MVKNISQFHDYTVEQLQKLSTKHLVAILGSARGQVICSCGHGHNCGDGIGITQEEREWNAKQSELFDNAKVALIGRENVRSITYVRPHKEKKVMKY